MPPRHRQVRLHSSFVVFYFVFVQRFPAVAAVISFDTFSLWVDEALEQMREMLAKNEHAAAYVENCFLLQEIREGVAIDG